MSIASTEPLGVVIHGAGRAGAAHAETYGCLAFTDPNAALQRDDIQIAMVALPNFLHEQATIAAAAAGKHVFLEKPMADTLDECERMLEAVERARIHLLVAHSQRYFAST